MAISLDFYQIVYKEEQLSKLYPFAKVYFNEKLTHFFENTVIKEIVSNSDAERISVCSWKLREKMQWNVCFPRPLTEDVLLSSYEVLSFTCNTKHHEFLNAADKWHPGFKITMAKLLGFIGEKMPSEIKNPIYQNHFSAKSHIYKDYVQNWLTPAMEVMDKDEELVKLCWTDSNYSNLNKKDAANVDFLVKSFGVGYYPMHPFILERLFALYCHTKKIKVTYL